MHRMLKAFYQVYPESEVSICLYLLMHSISFAMAEALKTEKVKYDQGYITVETYLNSMLLLLEIHTLFLYPQCHQQQGYIY